MMKKSFAELAGYGYPEGVRPRSVLGRVFDAGRDVAVFVRDAAPAVAVCLVMLVMLGAESVVDRVLGNTLPPTVEGGAE